MKNKVYMYDRAEEILFDWWNCLYSDSFSRNLSPIEKHIYWLLDLELRYSKYGGGS